MIRIDDAADGSGAEDRRVAHATGESGGPPMVSVLVASFNGGELLAEAIDSALAQTWPALEVLLIDDGSTDGSIEGLGRGRLEDPRLRVLRQPTNRGKSAALNRALGELRGAFYCLLDADDTCPPTRVERQVRFLLEEPRLAGAFTGYDLILDGRRCAPRFADRSIDDCARDIAVFRMPGHDPTAMYRVEAVADLRYAEDLPIGQGYDYILRVGERAPLAVLGEVLYSYRVQRSGATRGDPARRHGFMLDVLERARVRRGLSLEDASPALRDPAPKRSRRRDRDNNLAAQFIESVLDARRAGRRGLALRTGGKCVSLAPFDPHYWKALVYALVPVAVLGKLRRSRTVRKLMAESEAADADRGRASTAAED